MDEKGVAGSSQGKAGEDASGKENGFIHGGFRYLEDVYWPAGAEFELSAEPAAPAVKDWIICVWLSKYLL